jgi:hypothetical protein
MYFNYRYWGLILLFSLLVTSCATTTDYKDTVQAKFVGVWTGEHQIVDENILRKWKQTRNIDGTYELRFNVFKDGVPIDTVLETGKWWVKGDLFYEKNNTNMTEPDVYKFEFLDETRIKFMQVSFDKTTDIKDDNYSFVDVKVKNE